MKNLTKVLIILLIVMLLAVSTTSQAAKVEVTKEKLQEAFNNFKNLESDTDGVQVKEDVKIEVTDEVIMISSGEEKYEMKYDLTDGAIFTTETLIKVGMTYEEIEKETSVLSLPMLGYIGIANTQGVQIEDGMVYFILNLFGAAFESINLGEGIIEYEDNNSKGNTNSEVGDDEKVLTQEELDEYISTNFIDSTVKDDKGINSFNWDMKKEKLNDSSYKLVSKISVKLDADFSKIEELIDEMEDSFNTTGNEIISGTTSDEETNEAKNTTANIDTIPKAGTQFGVKNILQIVIFVSVLSIVIILITSKKEKN